jgi:hypothetical protein
MRFSANSKDQIISFQIESPLTNHFFWIHAVIIQAFFSVFLLIQIAFNEYSLYENVFFPSVDILSYFFLYFFPWKKPDY